MTPIRIKHEAELRELARAAFEHHRERALELIPRAEVEHVGSTSIPGALTKGDVDLLVRVQPGEFTAALGCLRQRYAVHQRENWTPTYASFVDPAATDPPIGVQLVVAGSADDLLFGPFRDALVRDRRLLSDYNALKRRLDGSDYQHYTDVKGKFVRDVLARLSARGPAATGAPRSPRPAWSPRARACGAGARTSPRRGARALDDRDPQPQPRDRDRLLVVGRTAVVGERRAVGVRGEQLELGHVAGGEGPAVRVQLEHLPRRTAGGRAPQPAGDQRLGAVRGDVEQARGDLRRVAGKRELGDHRRRAEQRVAAPGRGREPVDRGARRVASPARCRKPRSRSG